MRKFKNAIKVKCEKCRLTYWKEYGNMQKCCKCGGETSEFMKTQEDYNHKKQLENKAIEALV